MNRAGLTFTPLKFTASFILLAGLRKCGSTSASDDQQPGIMALTVVPSTRVFNGNGESLLIKVHSVYKWETIGRRRVGNHNGSAASVLAQYYAPVKTYSIIRGKYKARN